jgi:hypothetical protein
MFFKSISPNVDFIQLFPSFDETTQRADVYCTTKETSLKVIDAINYNNYYGYVVHGFIESKMARKALSGIETTLYIQYDLSNEIPTERELYFHMKQHGQVISVKVLKEKRIAFCTFCTEEEAEKALREPSFSGVHISKKKPSKKKTYQNPKKLTIVSPKKEVTIEHESSNNNDATKQETDEQKPEEIEANKSQKEKAKEEPRKNEIVEEKQEKPKMPTIEEIIKLQKEEAMKKQDVSRSSKQINGIFEPKKVSTNPLSHSMQRTFTIEPIYKNISKNENSSERSGSSRSSKKSRKNKGNSFIMKRQNSTQNISL